MNMQKCLGQERRKEIRKRERKKMYCTSPWHRLQPWLYEMCDTLLLVSQRINESFVLRTPIMNVERLLLIYVGPTSAM